MIRLLFRVTGEGGAVTLHSAEVHGSKAALLLDTPIAGIIGFEDCREINPRISISFAEQIAIAKQNGNELSEIIAKSKLWVPQTVGSNSENTAVVDAIKGQEIPQPNNMGLGGTAMDYRDLYESKEIQPAGPAGFIVVDDPASQEPPNPESVAEFFRETCASRRKKAKEEAGEDPRVLHGNGLHTKLWLMLRPNGEFVKSTTEEGGESYIACTSLDEAQKVAEQQKIYDIDCVPHRVF